MKWWSSPEWHAYERAYGDAPGQRARTLASATWRTRVIDLTQDEAALLRGVRKSYHSLINKTLRDLFVEVHYGSGAAKLIPTCMMLHALEAGWSTRPPETWKLMGDWTESEHGLFTMAVQLSEPPLPWTGVPAVGFAYFIRDGNWAYYASAASIAPNVNHALVWLAMRELKALGTRWLEMGWQGEATDEKGQAIEFFRRGFGGTDVLMSRVQDWCT